MRPSTDHRPKPAEFRKPARGRGVTATVKGQAAAPNLVVADKGIAARSRLYGKANNDYRDINRSWTVTWLRHRLREYVNVHGHASAGVCALLERAAEQYADGDYLRASAAANNDPDKMPEQLHQAARHAQLARSHELAAWELASREGAAKKANEGGMAMGNRNGKLSAIIKEDVTDSVPGTWGGVGAAEVEAMGGGEGSQGGGRDGADRRQGDPASTFDAPRGVDGRGTLSPVEPPKAESPPAKPAPAKLPLFLFCQPCQQQFRAKGGTTHCTKCGVAASLDEEDANAENSE